MLGLDSIRRLTHLQTDRRTDRQTKGHTDREAGSQAVRVDVPARQNGRGWQEGASFHYFECQLGNRKIEISSEVILCASPGG